MTAALALPRVTSRRVSHGIGDDPGSTSRLPAWWSADDWLDEVADVVRERRDVCREHHAEPDTVLAVARGMAAYADHRTGRDCRPTNARLVELLRVSLSTVQRCRRVLKALGLAVELVRGRSIMTRSERLEAWRRGSSHRKIAAVFALCSRRARGAKMRARMVRDTLSTRRARPTAVERDTPPGAASRERVSHHSSTHLRATTEQLRGRSAPAHTEGSHGRKRPAPDPKVRRLVEAVRGRVWWLRGVSTARMVPPLTRFAREGWSPRDVELGLRDALSTRGWTVPRELKQPAGYLAGLLRELDPADRPTAVEEAMAAAAAAERAHRLRIARPGVECCPHGQPGGHLPSPSGFLTCPSCRAAATSW